MHRRPDGVEIMEPKVSYDERVENMERSRAGDQRRIRKLEEELEPVRYAGESDEASAAEAEATPPRRRSDL